MDMIDVILPQPELSYPAIPRSYIQQGGYTGLNRAKQMSPEELIAEIKKSGLRGRGGGAFSTGAKLELLSRRVGEERFLVCNFDEGEPGTFKDRTIIEKNPHVLLEGIAIAALAAETDQVFIYLRVEYSYLLPYLQKAIDSAQGVGVFTNLKINIRLGAGAYVCGEETALLSSLEGKRGEPRFRPPYPSDRGLWGHPTLVNNVETLSCLPFILRNGAEKFASIGAPSYPGTKIITVSGDVVAPGAFEVPTDCKVKDIIYELAGGMKDSHALKAVLLGGHAGSFLTPEEIEAEINPEALAACRGMLGSGAMIVLNNTRNIVEISTRIAEFYAYESCGKCNPCREGTFRCREIMHKILAGKATHRDLSNLRILLRVMQRTALCGLGQTVMIPLISGMDKFYEDYEAEITAMLEVIAP